MPQSYCQTRAYLTFLLLLGRAVSGETGDGVFLAPDITMITAINTIPAKPRELRSRRVSVWSKDKGGEGWLGCSAPGLYPECISNWKYKNIKLSDKENITVINLLTR